MGTSSPLLSAPLRTPPKSICPSCGDTFTTVRFGEGDGRKQMFCGLNACYAEGIRAYWKARGFAATVQYEAGSPRLVGGPRRIR